MRRAAVSFLPLRPVEVSRQSFVADDDDTFVAETEDPVEIAWREWREVTPGSAIEMEQRSRIPDGIHIIGSAPPHIVERVALR